VKRIILLNCTAWRKASAVPFLSAVCGATGPGLSKDTGGPEVLCGAVQAFCRRRAAGHHGRNTASCSPSRRVRTLSSRRQAGNYPCHRPRGRLLPMNYARLRLHAGVDWRTHSERRDSGPGAHFEAVLIWKIHVYIWLSVANESMIQITKSIHRRDRTSFTLSAPGPGDRTNKVATAAAPVRCRKFCLTGDASGGLSAFGQAHHPGGFIIESAAVPHPGAEPRRRDRRLVELIAP
jgi:hypothetical protein